MRSCLMPAVLLGFLFVTADARAQTAPVRWGKIPEEQLAMARYPADSSAAAVILTDYGTVAFLSSGRIVFERHRRIKILREDGYGWGDVSIPYMAEGRAQRVEDLVGATYVRGADGQVKAHKLASDAVFDEDINGALRRKRFTLPALAPGAVLEYRYKVVSNNAIHLTGWTFQDAEPTLWSEFQADIPDGFQYITTMVGGVVFAVQESAQTSGGIGGVYRHRWVMRDVPALREEPYMTTPNDYRARISFQLQQILHANGGGLTYMTTWRDLADRLLESDGFGRWLGGSGALREQTSRLTATLTDPLQKLQAVYDYVRTNLQWNGQSGVMATQSMGDVLRKKTGSRAELALLLVAMLREAGLEADPVLISTRAHGRVQMLYPLTNQFDAMLAYVQVGEETFLLDATDPLRPYDLLPYEALVETGWRVRKDASEWIHITTRGKDAQQVYLEAELSADGTMAGRVQVTSYAYNALLKRQAMREGDVEDVLRTSLFEGIDDLEIDAPLVESDNDGTAPLRLTASFRIPGYAQSAGPYLYVNPQVLDRVQENPLRMPTRLFPVDHGYPADLVYTLLLKLPEGYTVQEQPGNITLAPAEGGISYRRQIHPAERMLTVQGRMIRPRTVFAPDAYAGLRAFYEQLVATHAQQIVLQKEAPEAEGQR